MEREHHSLADWDFIYAADWAAYHRYSLNTEVFVSPPSCLEFDPWPLDSVVYALSNLSQAQNLPAGRLTTWAYHRGTGVGRTSFVIGVTGPGSWGIHIRIPKHTDTFHRFRADWWQGFDGLGDPATIIETYTWDGSGWVIFGSSAEPPISGALNRIGLSILPGNSPPQLYYDDTEIWLPI